MKNFIMLLMLLVISGCSTVTIETSIDGSCKATRTAIFVDASSIQGDACGGSVGATDTSSNTKLIDLLLKLYGGK